MYDVSVIVPVYNGESSIDEAMSCLLSQSLKERLQVVVVDDGSTDGSLERARSYAEPDSDRVLVIHTENHGAAHARNVGLRHATGDYVGFLDCDDSADATMYEQLVTLAHHESADIATCGYLRVEGDEVQRRDYVSRPCFGYPIVKAPSLLQRNVPYVWNKLFRRAFLEEHGLCFDEDLRIYEDLVLTYEAFACANKVVRVNRTLYVYNFAREGSLTADFSEKRLDLVPAFERLVGFYRDRNLVFHTEDELLRCFLTHFYAALQNSSLESLGGPVTSQFVSECLAFLDKNFPWWRKFDTFFKQRRLPAPIYGNGTFLRAILASPDAVKRRALKQGNVSSRLLSTARPGMHFMRALLDKPVDPKKVVLDSQRGANLNGNMFYLLKELTSSKRYEGWNVCLTYGSKADKRSFEKLLEATELNTERVTLQKYNSQQYAENLATASLICTDTSLPVYYVKREGQRYLNTWHGTPLKCLGRDMEEGFAETANLTKNFLAADVLAYQGEFMDSCMRSAYMYAGCESGTTVLEGYPRNEPLVDPAGVAEKTEREIATREPGGTRVRQRIAYLPTWRGSASGNRAEETGIASILREIDGQLSDDQIMYVKLHPYDFSSAGLERLRHVRPYPTVDETYAVLSLCDVLVTDYSSVLFDFTVTGKPIVLFTYDEEDYLRDRGLYCELDEVGLPRVKTASELVRALSELAATSDASESVRERFVPNESSRCSQRLLDAALQRPADDLNVAHAPKPQEVLKPALLFCGDLRSSLVTHEVLDVLSKTTATSDVCLTYDMEKSCNLSLLKGLPRAVRLWGRSFPLSATTREERVLLAKVQLDPKRSERHQKELLVIAEREASRSWPGVRFSHAIVYGRESLMNLLLATCCADKSTLIVRSSDDMERVPRWILDRFDTIIRENPERALEMLIA